MAQFGVRGGPSRMWMCSSQVLCNLRSCLLPLSHPPSSATSSCGSILLLAGLSQPPGSALPQEPPAWFFPSEPGFSPFLMEWSRFPPLFWHLALCTLALPAPPFSARELPDLALFGGTGWSFLFQRRAKGLSPLPAAGNVVLFVYSNSGGGCFRAPMGSLCLGLVLSCSL